MASMGGRWTVCTVPTEREIGGAVRGLMSDTAQTAKLVGASCSCPSPRSRRHMPQRLILVLADQTMRRQSGSPLQFARQPVHGRVGRLLLRRHRTSHRPGARRDLRRGNRPGPAGQPGARDLREALRASSPIRSSWSAAARRGSRQQAVRRGAQDYSCWSVSTRTRCPRPWTACSTASYMPRRRRAGRSAQSSRSTRSRMPWSAPTPPAMSRISIHAEE